MNDEGGRRDGRRDDRERCEMTGWQRRMEGRKQGGDGFISVAEQTVQRGSSLARCKSVIKSRLLLMYCTCLGETYWELGYYNISL